jgi:hypothetical protein
MHCSIPGTVKTTTNVIINLILASKFLSSASAGLLSTARGATLGGPRDWQWPCTMITHSIDADTKAGRFGLAPGDLPRAERSDASRKSIETNFAEAE